MKPVDAGAAGPRRSTAPAPISPAQEPNGAAEAPAALAMARGILGVGPVRPGPDRVARHRPGHGRARLYAAPRRQAQLADPSFDERARGRARSRNCSSGCTARRSSAATSSPASRAMPRAAGSRGLPTAMSSRSAGFMPTRSGRSPAANLRCCEVAARREVGMSGVSPLRVACKEKRTSAPTAPLHRRDIHIRSTDKPLSG